MNENLKSREGKTLPWSFFPSSDKQVLFWNRISREHNSFVLVLRSRIVVRVQKTHFTGWSSSKVFFLGVLFIYFFCTFLRFSVFLWFYFLVDWCPYHWSSILFQLSQPAHVEWIYHANTEHAQSWYLPSWLRKQTPAQQRLGSEDIKLPTQGSLQVDAGLDEMHTMNSRGRVTGVKSHKLQQ